MSILLTNRSKIMARTKKNTINKRVQTVSRLKPQTTIQIYSLENRHEVENLVRILRQSAGKKQNLMSKRIAVGKSKVFAEKATTEKLVTVETPA